MARGPRRWSDLGSIGGPFGWDGMSSYLQKVWKSLTGSNRRGRRNRKRNEGTYLTYESLEARDLMTVDVQNFHLVNDTGYSDTDLITRDPKVTAIVGGDFDGGSVVVEFSLDSGTNVLGSETVTEPDDSFEFDPLAADSSLNTYEGYFYLSWRTIEYDDQQNVVDTSSWSTFSITLDRIAPTVLYFSPSLGETVFTEPNIGVGFSELVSPNSASEPYVWLTETGSSYEPEHSVQSLSSPSNWIYLTAKDSSNQTTLLGEHYTTHVQGVEDVAGNVLAAPESASWDTPFPTLSVDNNQVTENYLNTSGTYLTANLSSNPWRPASFDAAGNTVSFSLGSSSTGFGSVGSDAQGGDGFEGDEVHEFPLSNPVGLHFGSNTNPTLTIVETDTPPTLQFGAAWHVVSETTSPVSVSVGVSGTLAFDLVIPYSVSTTPSGAPNYEVASGTITIEAGQFTGTIEVPLEDDLLEEGFELLVFTIGDPLPILGGGSHWPELFGGSGTPPTHTLVIEDDETPEIVTVGFAGPSYLHAPGTVALERDRTTTEGAWVEYEVLAPYWSTEVIGGGVVWFEEGETIAEFVPSLFSNPYYSSFSADVNYPIVLTRSWNVQLGSVTSTSYSVQDDTVIPYLSFANISSTVTEGEEPEPLHLHLSRPYYDSINISLTVVTGSSTATEDEDFTLSTHSFSFYPYQTDLEIPWELLEDYLIEGDETLYLEASSNLSYSLQAWASFTIEDNDFPLTVGFDDTTLNVEEDAESVEITVVLSEVRAYDVEVSYSLGGTASQDDDYELANGTIVILAGHTSATLEIPLLDDEDWEPSETLTITLSDPIFATLSENSVFTLTILNDDLPTVEFAGATSSADEAEDNLEIPVTLSYAVGEAVTVSYRVTTTGTTATGSGVDYTLASGTLEFVANETTKSILLNILDDERWEFSETIRILLEDPVGAILGTQDAHVHTITNDDPLPVVSFQSSSSSNDEGETSVEIVVVLDRPSDDTITVDYAVVGGTAKGAGEDFSLASGTLTFNPGQTSRSINVSVEDDVYDESDETIQLVLSNPSQATLGDDEHESTIEDNDEPVTVAFAESSSTVEEDQGEYTLTVVLSHASQHDVQVAYALGTSALIEDGSETPGVLTILAGTTSAEIVLNVLDNSLKSLNEPVDVTLSSPSEGELGSPTTHTLSIVNDDFPTVAFTTTSSQVEESDGTVEISLTLSDSVGYPVTVSYRRRTAGSTAALGTDVNWVTDTVTFAANTTTASINLAIEDDQDREDTEMFVLELFDAVQATLGANDECTLTITDDDPPPSVGFLIGFQGTPESSSNITTEVVLSHQTFETVTVNYAWANTSTAQAGGVDATFTPGTLTFAPGETSKTISWSIVNDIRHEDEEVVRLTLSNAVHAILGTANTTYVILDDDPLPAASFLASSSSSNTPITVSENAGTVSIPVYLDRASDEDVIVHYRLAPIAGTASPTQDYTLNSNSVTIAAGDTSATIEFSINDNFLHEETESIQLLLFNAENATLGATTQKTILIEDNDPLPTVQFASGSFQMSEGEKDGAHNYSLAIELQLSGTYPDPVEVQVELLRKSGDATWGQDFVVDGMGSAPYLTVKFNADQTTKQIELTALLDGLVEPTEEFTLRLLTPLNAALGTVSSVDVSILDVAKDVNGTTIVQDVEFEKGYSYLLEGDYSFSLPVNLTLASEQSITVGYRVHEDSTGDADTDFVLESGTLTFAAGVTSQLIEVEIKDRLGAQGSRTLIVELFDPTGGFELGQATHTLTIQDQGTFSLASELTIDPWETLDVDESGADPSYRLFYVPIAYAGPNVYGNAALPQVHYRVQAATGSSAGTAGTDFYTSTVLLGPGGEIAVRINADPLAVDGKTLEVELFDATWARLGNDALTVTLAVTPAESPFEEEPAEESPGIWSTYYDSTSVGYRSHYSFVYEYVEDFFSGDEYAEYSHTFSPITIESLTPVRELYGNETSATIQLRITGADAALNPAPTGPLSLYYSFGAQTGEIVLDTDEATQDVSLELDLTNGIHGFSLTLYSPEAKGTIEWFRNTITNEVMPAPWNSPWGNEYWTDTSSPYYQSNWELDHTTEENLGYTSSVALDFFFTITPYLATSSNDQSYVEQERDLVWDVDVNYGLDGYPFALGYREGLTSRSYTFQVEAASESGAVANTDFEILTESITFEPGQSRQQVRVHLKDNAARENLEGLLLNLVPDDDYWGAQTFQLSAQVIDNDLVHTAPTTVSAEPSWSPRYENLLASPSNLPVLAEQVDPQTGEFETGASRTGFATHPQFPGLRRGLRAAHAG